jgi:hypothetical protein
MAAIIRLAKSGSGWTISNDAPGIRYLFVLSMMLPLQSSEPIASSACSSSDTYQPRLSCERIARRGDSLSLRTPPGEESGVNDFAAH